MASHEGHAFTRTVGGKGCCAKCGLLRLNNDLTDWCVRKGCDYPDDPGYRQAVATLPEQYRRRHGRG